MSGRQQNKKGRNRKAPSGSTSNNSKVRVLIINLRYREPTNNTYLDGVKIKELLINSCGFKAEDIELWKDANDGGGPGFLIDAAKIRQKLRQLIEISQPGDTLIFYFSGHGDYDAERQRHLVAADGSALYGYDFVPALDSMADGVKATFIIDACYGGGFIELAHPKVVLYASSKEDEESTGGSLGSLFTNVFVNCVKQNPQITHKQLIIEIQIKYRNHGGKPVANLIAAPETQNSIIFQ